jgi:hypothetical protein
MDDEAAEFWSAFESETGEKIEARSMGELYQTSGRDSGLWGLLVLTDKSFRFKYMPSDNWLSSIFKKTSRSSKPKETHDIVVPRGDIISINAPKGGFLARLFGPAFPHFTIAFHDAEGEKLHSFSVDPGSGLLAALMKAAPATETRN